MNCFAIKADVIREAEKSHGKFVNTPNLCDDLHSSRSRGAGAPITILDA